MHDPPRFFAKKFTANSACFYYRVQNLITPLHEMGVDVTTGGEWEGDGEDFMRQYLMALSVQDFVFYYASGGATTKALVKFLNTKAKWEGGPCYLADLDDNCDFVSPMNSRFGRLGTRMPNGRLLKKDEAVNIVLPDGDRIEVWKDGKDGVSWEENRKSMKAMNWTFKNSAGTTFTTQRLADYYKNRYRIPNVYVRPNAINLADYPVINLKKDTGVIRLFWQGGDAHYPDFYPMKLALEHAMQKFPELRLVIWGPLYPWVYENIDRDRIEHHEWIGYDAYKIKLASLDFDIAMAPLVGNKFNQYKSCIKWYEAAAVGDPKPILAAREAPYKDEITDGFDGMLFDMPTDKDPTATEFQQKLEQLIRSEQLRKEIAANAREFIVEHRDAHTVAADYWEWAKDTRAQYLREVELAKLRKVSS